MIPRFLRTFLIISTLIILSTLYILYPLHTHPFITRTSTVSTLASEKDGHSGSIEEDILAREDHWDKGGAEPDYPRTTARTRTGSAGSGSGSGSGGEDDLGTALGTAVRGDESTVTTTLPPLRPRPRPTPPHTHHDDDDDDDDDKITHDQLKADVQPGINEVETGAVIMSRLGNATAKAELGRAAWKVLHTMTLRFPEHPTLDERAALKSYMHLFARLYPCGECAQEFQGLLKEYPPQTSSRKAASVWLCSMHNLVNARLGKEEFDCNALEGTYDCGCGGDGEDGEGVEGEVKGEEGAGVDQDAMGRRRRWG